MNLPPLTPGEPHLLTNFTIPTNWMVREPERFTALIEEAIGLVESGHFFGDNLFTWARNNSMFDDRPFRTAWEANCLTSADRALIWRRYITATLAYHAVQLPGDFVECGVYQGTGVKTVVDYLGGQTFPKTFWAYDTFDYNPVLGHTFPGQQPGFFAQVQSRFAGYSQVRLVQGLIPEVFAEHCPERIAYLHIDLNSRDAEIATLEKLFERLVPGGVIVLDDYEWANVYRAQKLAEDVWFDQRQYRVTPLPTGQGIVFKR